MVTIGQAMRLPPAAVSKELRHYGAEWCRLECKNHGTLLAFAALSAVPMKFYRPGQGYLVPASMREELIKAGAEPE